MTTFNFNQKIVLITGASRGIGRECALQFAKQGAKVAVHYHTNQAAAKDTLQRLAGTGHSLVHGDIANPDDVRRIVDTTAQRMGGLDILVNNAGIYSEHPVHEVTYDQWQADWTRIIQTNLIGAANAIFCVVPHMVRRGGGRVINISSRGAFRGEPMGPAYGASKAGMNAMGQSIAVALAPFHIYVATVAPGWVETDMATAYLASAEGAAIRNQSPLKRVAKPEEVAYAVLFLASQGAEFMTGAILDVNGASYLRT